MTRTAFSLAMISVLTVPAAAPAPEHQEHHTVTPASIKWDPIAPQMWMAVVSGSPDSDGSPFVIRIRLAHGVKVPPHWHPVDEHITVLSGAFHMGQGEVFDSTVAAAMTAGVYAMMPKGVRHYGWSVGETVLQIHGTGPFKTNFVELPKPNQ